MSDTTLNRFLARGTNAERLAFTPVPPTPASGPDNLYVFYETDTGNVFMWDGADWVFFFKVTGSLNAQSGTAYTLELEDNQGTVTLSNGSGCVVTIPDNATVPLPLNAQILLIALTAGTVQVVPDAGVTLIARGSFDKLAGLGAMAVLVQTAVDEWVFNGDTAT